MLWREGLPDHKTIANFCKDNGSAIRKVCARFVALCRQLELFADASVAIDGSKFKAVITRDRNFTRAKMTRRLAQIEESVGCYGPREESAALTREIYAGPAMCLSAGPASIERLS